MLVYALILLAIAGLISLVVAFSALRGQAASWIMSLLQLVTGGAGLWIVLQSVMGGEDKVTLPFAVLAIAFIAGLYMALSQLRGGSASRGVALVHTGLWIIGVGLLGAMMFIHNLTY